MADDDIRPEMLGLRLTTEEENPEVHAECLRIARRIRFAGGKRIGLLPVGPAAVPPVGIHLGLALTALTGSPIAYVDANLRWPALSPTVGEQADGGTKGLFALRWLAGPSFGGAPSSTARLALLVPTERCAAGRSDLELEHLLSAYADSFEHLLVDLTGFDRLGEHLSAFSRVDGLVLVAQAGRTREQELRDLRADLPSMRELGVVLVGLRS